jgi:site-specific DNA-methyltransferase (adenine-specific)
MNQLDPKFVNQVLHCDCVKGMRQLPDCCIPLTVTSPPYDHLRDLRHPDYDRLVGELYRVTGVGGVVAWVVGDTVVNGVETGTSCAHRTLLEKAGFLIYQTLIAATNGLPFLYARRYATAHEYVFICAKGNAMTANVLSDKQNRTAGQKGSKGRRDPSRTTPYWGCRTSVWTYLNGKYLATDKTAFGHPALMPEDLAEDLIVSYSRPGELVFDPMCGAATTCKMALLNNRPYLGMEIHEPYVLVARARLTSARAKQRRRLDDLFGDCDPTT